MEQKKESRTAGILFTLCGGVCWGLSGCFGQFLFQERSLTAEWLVAVRMLLAGLLLVMIGHIVQGKKVNDIFRDKKDRKQLFWFSVFGMLFCQYTYFAAIAESNAGTATVLQSTAPILILAVVCITRPRLPKGVEALAILGALVGTFLLSTHGDISSMQLTPLALILGLCAAAGAAMYNLMSSKILQKYGVYPVVGYGMLIAGILMCIVVRPWEREVPTDIQTILATAGVIIIGTAVAFSLYLKGVSIVGPFMGSLLGSVEPVTAIVVSFLFLHSDFQLLDLVGFALILVTVTLLSTRKQSIGT